MALLENLALTGPEGQAAVDYLVNHRVKLNTKRQSTAARWTLGRQIQIHPRYADGPADAPYALSLIVHEIRHLQQGPYTALSVYGELDAWQAQFRFLKQLTGQFHEAPFHAETIASLMSLPNGLDRPTLERARTLMRRYAGDKYRIDLLPLFPLPSELAFWLGHLGAARGAGTQQN
jgi:hypothetical protein